MRSIQTIIIAVMLLAVTKVQADESFHPSRARLIIHAKRKLGNGMQLRTHFIPAPNLIGGLAPMAYLGIGFKPTGWLDIEPLAGWTFLEDEPILSVRLVPAVKKVWAWVDFELVLPSNGGYFAGQLQYKLLGWLHAGVESESWGDLADGSSWSHGAGPNILFLLDNYGLDLTLHIRDLEGKIKPEFLLRAHIFL